MTEYKERAFEAVKTSMRQDRDGIKITLCVHPSDLPKALMEDWVGARYQAILYLLDDEGHVLTPTADPDEEAGKKLVAHAAMLCKDRDFWRYLNNTGMESVIVDSEQIAANVMRRRLMIESRSEIKKYPDRFRGLVAAHNVWRSSN